MAELGAPIHLALVKAYQAADQTTAPRALSAWADTRPRPISRLLTGPSRYALHAPRRKSQVDLNKSSTTGSIALTLVLLEAQPLRFHALYLFIKCVNFLIDPRVFRFWRIAAAKLFERFLNGEFADFGHGNPSSLF
jgi:hypothetical protein